MFMPAGMFLNLLEIREMGAENLCTQLFMFSVLKFSSSSSCIENSQNYG